MIKNQPRAVAPEDLAARLIKAYEKNITTFPVPPADFDPRTADPERLFHFGLPLRPDFDREPEKYDFWSRMLAPPLTFVEARFEFPRHHQVSRRKIAAQTREPREASSNWSGGYITAKGARMFVEVYGAWQVPVPLAPSTANGQYRCSTWIGLDGQRRYLNSSLPQIGTAQFVRAANGHEERTVMAWWQWWVRGQHYRPGKISLAVKPGDLVMCSLIVTGRDRVRFFIKNQTTGTFVAPFEKVAPPAIMPPGPSPVPLAVSGATAEWITERPRDFRTQKLFRLPNYERVRFRDCFAVAAPAPGKTGRGETLSSAKLIDMFEVRQNPTRVARISTAERTGPHGVVTTYRP
jgi:hypothetical protein